MPKMQLHPEYVTDSAGKRRAVILPVAEYKELLEDLADLAVIAERREMPTVPRQKVKSQPKRDGHL